MHLGDGVCARVQLARAALGLGDGAALAVEGSRDFLQHRGHALRRVHHLRAETEAARGQQDSRKPLPASPALCRLLATVHIVYVGASSQFWAAPGASVSQLLHL